MQKRSRMPVDPSKLAKQVIDQATGKAEPDPDDEKDQAAMARGRRGGLKGGVARAGKLSARKRSQIAKKAAAARWNKAE